MDVKQDLTNYIGPDRVVSSVAYAKLLEALPPVRRHLTGLPQLDEAIGGFEVGELIVVSGPTSMGKTTFCETILNNLNQESKKSLFFTYEVTPGKLIEGHKEPESSLFLPLEHKAMNLAWLRERTLEAIQKYDISAVFIDHLHYIIDMTTNHNMSLEIGATMRFLKRDIAIGLNIPVFIVCHSAKIPFDQEPSMNHLRDSSFVAQEADTVLVIFRRMDLDFSGKKLSSMLQGLASIKVEKARRIGTMGLKIKVKKKGHTLVESHDEPEEADDKHRHRRT